MASKLGTLLLNAGAISKEQLEEALQAQVMFGGRIGTNLIELGFITEEFLARFLGKQYNIPFCAKEDLQNISPKIIKLLPKNLIIKHRVVPIRKSGKQIWIAMVDPSMRPALDEISSATGFKIHPMIAPEIHVIEAMERYYQIPKESRYVQLSGSDGNAKLNLLYSTRDFIDDIPIPGTLPQAPVENTPKRMINRSSQLTEYSLTPPPVTATPTEDLIIDVEELKPEVEIEKAPPATPQPVAPQPVAPTSEPPETVIEAIDQIENEEDSLFPLQDISEVLTEARSKDDIFQAILSPFMEFFDRYALFINKNDFMVGFSGSGEGLGKEELEKIAIPLRVPSIFRDVSEKKAPIFAPFPNGHNNQKIAQMLLHKESKDPCLVCPIPLVQKIGVIVFADQCRDPKAVEKRLGKFEKLMTKAGITFQVLVLKQKILHL